MQDFKLEDERIVHNCPICTRYFDRINKFQIFSKHHAVDTPFAYYAL